jgi:UMF1 family MFS transporter
MNLRAALQPGVSRRELLAWALYDVANSGYTTVVLTAVFSAYFVSAIAGNAPWASFAWTATLAVSSLLVMLTMPALGAWADLRARRGVLLRLSTVGCVLATAMLSLLGPGMLEAAIVLVILSSYCYTVGESTIAAYLPELARREALGRVSGWGWGLGYVGGMFTLGLSLAWVLSAPSRGQTAGEAVPFTMLITAAVFAAASLPPLLLLRERTPARAAQAPQRAGAAIRQAFARLGQTWRESGSLVDLRRLLLLGAVYQAGIAVVIALAAVYAQQQMGFTEVQTMTLIFAVNVAAAGGALSFGHFQDRVGHRRSLGLTLLGWVVVCLLAGLASSVTMFWLAATLAGLCMGSSQSAGRAMLGALAPPARLTEFYGLWAFAGRVAAIVGPLTYGGVTWASGGDHRLAILSTGLFFVIALILLRDIDIERGALAARATDQPAR